ncbi:hypothetical protein RHMOL_Rhmol07G0222800 [Rhododendron molle]|uniref:Uncharacterized protein n=1 Tax=Rhododendron molle TaxID=49168 RepID=A0ACC0N3U2_RHOML|nr:hypothetical protein RHMOL_Rhmol07G0222800 [Rhododendron molle]
MVHSSSPHSGIGADMGSVSSMEIPISVPNTPNAIPCTVGCFRLVPGDCVVVWHCGGDSGGGGEIGG